MIRLKTKTQALRTTFLLLLCSLTITNCKPKQPELPTVDSIRQSINLSANYLTRQTKANGMFVYRVNMNPDVKIKEEYNILRHAGAIYSMVMAYEVNPDKDLKAAIERAGKYLRDEAISKVEGQKDIHAVWSKPEVNGTTDPLQVKLGGVGLGLVALLSIEKISPGFTSIEDLRALGRFIVFMQKDDGSFYSKYIPSMGGRDENWKSLFYPGEAALGLLMLYEKDRSDIWLKAATNALEYLALTRVNLPSVPADHWALLATEKIIPFKQNDLTPTSKALLISHGIQVCEAFLNQQIDSVKNPALNGGFNKDGRTTTTSASLEGLIAALSFIPPDHEIRKRIETAINRGMTFLLRAQVKEGEFAGALPFAVTKTEGNGLEIAEFNRQSTEVQIDYVQHALSAMIAYEHIQMSGTDKQ